MVFDGIEQLRKVTSRLGRTNFLHEIRLSDYLVSATRTNRIGTDNRRLRPETAGVKDLRVGGLLITTSTTATTPPGRSAFFF